MGGTKARILASAIILFLIAMIVPLAMPQTAAAAATIWKAQKSGVSEHLYDVSAADSRHVWAVGENGTVLFYNGSVWRTQAHDSAYDLFGVTALDDHHVWAVGSGGMVRFFNGNSWVAQDTGYSQHLMSVSALDKRHVWAVGLSELASFFDGTSWNSELIPGVTANLRGVSALNAGYVWAVGDVSVGDATVLWNNGTDWSSVPSGSVNQLYDVSTLDENHAWAVGPYGNIRMYDGHTWNFQDSGVPSTTLQGVSALDGSHVWAVGFSGTVLFYNGSSWSRQSSGASLRLDDVCALDATHIWAVGEGGTIIFGSKTPSMASLSPGSGSVGSAVKITGRDFGRQRDSSHVMFAGGNKATSYASWSDTEIRCTVPAGAVSGQVRVTTAGGTSNGKEFTVTPEPQATWYLAEGSTAWGFSCYISIENPNASEVNAEITYQTTNGPVSGGTVNLPAKSQATVSPAGKLGNQDFSTKVVCKEGNTIAVDRTMTWTGTGAASEEAHSSIGVTSPAPTWYLAEGSSKWGFESWLLIQNPNSTEASCNVTYMIEEEGPKTVNHKVPANSRQTFSMEADIGNKDASIKVDSQVPVIPERAMYRNSRREGHDSIGTTQPDFDYFLAEGTTNYGFTTYMLIQNPNDVSADVTVTYMTDKGPVAYPQNPVKMSANSRKTIRVNVLTPGVDFSTHVHASAPVIAERAMYWGADTPLGEATHDSIGTNFAHKTFYLPDGETSNGRETWTLVQNPNSAPVKVQISYLTPTGDGNAVFTDTVNANSRKTYQMSQKIKSGRAAILVSSLTSGKKIIVERAMYWNMAGAGTDTIGGYSD